jgi:hypothetical protein
MNDGYHNMQRTGFTSMSSGTMAVVGRVAGDERKAQPVLSWLTTVDATSVNTRMTDDSDSAILKDNLNDSHRVTKRGNERDCVAF